MKKIFLAVVVLISLSLFSCTPSTPVTPSTNNVVIGPQPKFQFKANGTLYICDALFDSRIGWYGNYYQQLQQDGGGVCPGFYPYDNVGDSYLGGGCSTDMNGDAFVCLGITTSSITNGTFSTTNLSAADCHFAAFPITSPAYWIATQQTIVITRVSNGTADGTFSANLTSSVGNSSVNITEGTFSNIPVIN